MSMRAISQKSEIIFVCCAGAPESNGTSAGSTPLYFSTADQGWESWDYSENGIRGTLALTPCPLPQERGKHAQFSGIFAPLGVALLHGTTPKMRLEERLALTLASPPGEGEARSPSP